MPTPNTATQYLFNGQFRPTGTEHYKRGGEGGVGKVKLANLPNTSVRGCSNGNKIWVTATVLRKRTDLNLTVPETSFMKLCLSKVSNPVEA